MRDETKEVFKAMTYTTILLLMLSLELLIYFGLCMGVVYLMCLGFGWEFDPIIGIAGATAALFIKTMLYSDSKK